MTKGKSFSIDAIEENYGNQFPNYLDWIKEIVRSDTTIKEYSSSLIEENLKLLDKGSTNQLFFYKILLIGDRAVGKTLLRQSYLKSGVVASFMKTLGVDFPVSPSIQVGKNRAVRLQIWDLAGEQIFSRMRGSFFGGAYGALLVFDVTQRETFENIPSWINFLWKWNGKGPIPLVLVGNKIDLRDSQEGDHISDEEALEYASKLDSEIRPKLGFRVSYVPTSAKSGHNIGEIFKEIAFNIVSFQAFVENSGLGPLFGL